MEISNRNYTEKFLTSYAFMRFIFLEVSSLLSPGVILVTESKDDAKILAKNLEKCGWAKICKNKNDSENLPSNFQMGIKILRKDEPEESAIQFLDNEHFLPVLIAAGIAPDYSEECGVVIRMNTKLSKSNEKEFKEFRDWILLNLEAVVYEIKTVSSILDEADFAAKMSPIMQIIYMIGSIWHMYLRELNSDEETADDWMLDFLEWGKQLIAKSESLTGLYQISDAVRYSVYKYIEEGNYLLVKSLEDVHDDMLETVIEEVIFFDETMYYVPEEILRKICRTLTETITFHQIKVELEHEGTLVCNNTKKRNFTVKKTLPLGDTFTRLRFLALKKEAFLSESGQYLEEAMEMYMNVMEAEANEIRDF